MGWMGIVLFKTVSELDNFSFTFIRPITFEIATPNLTAVAPAPAWREGKEIRHLPPTLFLLASLISLSSNSILLSFLRHANEQMRAPRTLLPRDERGRFLYWLVRFAPAVVPNWRQNVNK